MRKKGQVCRSACPGHGHYCDKAPPHLEHASTEACECRWDNCNGIIIGGALEAHEIPGRPFEDVLLPEPQEENDEQGG